MDRALSAVGWVALPSGRTALKGTILEKVGLKRPPQLSCGASGRAAQTHIDARFQNVDPHYIASEGKDEF